MEFQFNILNLFNHPELQPAVGEHFGAQHGGAGAIDAPVAGVRGQPGDYGDIAGELLSGRLLRSRRAALPAQNRKEPN